MIQFISVLKQFWGNKPFFWYDDSFRGDDTVPLPANAKVVVLAPHPDDPESVAVTTRLFIRNDCDIRYVVITLSPSGVQDGYASQFLNEPHGSSLGQKKAIRQREQIKASELFGLSREKLTFLCLDEKGKEDAPSSPDYRHDIAQVLESMAPDVVLMPSGNDTNATHKAVCNSFRASAGEWVRKHKKPLVALYNEDPKTTLIRKDLFVLFGKQRAEWKRSLLRAHDSQQQRNLNLRQTGFDERILNINRHCIAERLELTGLNKIPDIYAEAFEIELFDTP